MRKMKKEKFHCRWSSNDLDTNARQFHTNTKNRSCTSAKRFTPTVYVSIDSNDALHDLNENNLIIMNRCLSFRKCASFWSDAVNKVFL